MKRESRGACPACGRVMQVRADGTMRDHRPFNSPNTCTGVGQAPSPAAFHRGTFSVYRCYDSADRLLYIGCTHALTDRMWGHATTGAQKSSIELRHRMVRYEVEEHADRETALAAEREAIRNEAPLLNVTYNMGRGMKNLPPLDGEQAAA